MSSEPPTAADRDRAELRRHRVELEAVESQLASLNQRAEALRTLVTAYQRLVALHEGRELPRDTRFYGGSAEERIQVRSGRVVLRDPAGRLRETGEVRLRAPRAMASEAKPEPPQAKVQMRAKDAVRLVLGETLRPWQITPLAKEVERRGIDIGSTNPVAAIRTATLRMYQKGELARIKDGVYALPSVAQRDGLPLGEGGGDEG